MKVIVRRLMLIWFLVSVPRPGLTQECRMLQQESFVPQNKRVLLVANSQDEISAKKIVVFQTPLRVNTDGAPNSYHPFDLTGHEKAINHICNAISVRSSPGGVKQKCSKAVEIFARFRDSNWTVPPGFKITWTNVISSKIVGNKKQPCVFESGEFQGYFASLTRLQNGLASTEQGECSVNNQLDQRVVPALVMAGGNNPMKKFGADIGDLLVAFNPSTRLFSAAIVGDSGPDDNLGEGSVALNMALLGRTDQPRNYMQAKQLDTGNQEVVVSVFPASRSFMPQKPYNKENIETRTTKFLQESGFENTEKFVEFAQKCLEPPH